MLSSLKVQEVLVSGARIVRGNRSIQGSNNALIVVDGVPISNGTNGTVTSDFGGFQGTDGASQHQS